MSVWCIYDFGVHWIRGSRTLRTFYNSRGPLATNGHSLRSNYSVQLLYTSLAFVVWCLEWNIIKRGNKRVRLFYSYCNRLEVLTGQYCCIVLLLSLNLQFYHQSRRTLLRRARLVLEGATTDLIKSSLVHLEVSWGTNVAGDVQNILNIESRSLETLHAFPINLCVFPRSVVSSEKCRMLALSEARPKSVDVRINTPSQTLSGIIHPCPVTTTKINSHCSFLVLIVLWRRPIALVEALRAWQNSENRSLEPDFISSCLYLLTIFLFFLMYIDLRLQPVLLWIEIPMEYLSHTR